MTKDGIVGYVKEKHVKQSYYKEVQGSFVPPVYTAQTRPEKINLYSTRYSARIPVKSWKSL